MERAEWRGVRDAMKLLTEGCQELCRVETRPSVKPQCKGEKAGVSTIANEVLR